MANVIFEDLSGVSTPVGGNPYESLIKATNDDPAKLQERYNAHRTTRNAQQKTTILDSDFSGWSLDPFLMKLDGPKKDPDFVDPRNCLVFWARPPKKVRDLIGRVQSKLQSVAPNLWLMPPENLHMTALEVTHSLTSQEVDKLVEKLRPNISQIADFTYYHRARLVKPIISYDNAALALSLLPAAGETPDNGRKLEEDEYTYHHLRRDLYNLCSASGVTVGSRYVVPSAHFTIARFISQDPFSEGSAGEAEFKPDAEKLRDWIEKIEDINAWLQQEYWPKEGNAIEPGGEWVVGEEKGLDCRRGRLWYGGGETIKLGKGF